jgi:hypothetical protein
MSASSNTFLRQGRLCLGIVLLAIAAGCSQQPDRALPPPAPAGANVNSVVQSQIDGAMADRFTVYRHEWANDGDIPGDYGSRHLDEIARRIDETDHPVLIERDADNQLNELRRDYLVRYLAARNITQPDRRVIVGRPTAPGISGDEAIEIYANNKRG